MGTPSLNSEPVRPLACLDCLSELKPGQKKCLACGSYQDWRKHLNFSQNILALLVAFISVCGITVVSLIDSFKSPNSDIKAVSVSHGVRFDGIIYWEVFYTNAGTRPAIVTNARIRFIDHSGDTVFIPEPMQFEATVVQPGESALVTYNFPLSGLYDNAMMIINPSLRISVSNFDTEISKIRFDPYLNVQGGWATVGPFKNADSVYNSIMEGRGRKGSYMKLEKSDKFPMRTPRN